MVYRQRDTEDMRDFTDLGAGKVEEAVRSLHARDRIYVLEEYRHRAAAIIDLYLQERRRGRGAGDIGTIVDGSNHVLDDLNRRIQRERILMKEIAPRGIEVRATDEERSWSLHRGDLVVFRERVATATDEVVRSGEQGRIVTADHGHRRITVALGTGRRVTVDLQAQAPAQPVVPAYAAHVTTCAGGETPVVIVSPGRHATRHSADTATTRAIEELHVVIDRQTFGQDPIDGLIRDWSRTMEKRPAWSQLDDAARERWGRWRAGEEAPAGDRPERTAGQHPAGRDVDPNADTVPMPSVASRGRHAAPGTRDDARERRDRVPAGRHRKPCEHDDIAARARRGAEALDAPRRGDLGGVGEAIRDRRDAEADDAEVAANRAASVAAIRLGWHRPDQGCGDAARAAEHPDVARACRRYSRRAPVATAGPRPRPG